MDKKKLYTAEEIAKYIGGKVTADTVWRWGRQGKLKRVKVGRLVRFELPKAEEAGKDD